MATAEFVLAKAPYFLQVATGTPLYYDAQSFREFNGSHQRRPGILGVEDFWVTQNIDVGWSLQVLGGYANIVQAVGAGGPGQNIGGVYTVYMPLNKPDIVIPWRPPGSGTRTHKLFLAVYDPLIQGNATQAKIVATEDVGSGAPAPVGAAGYLQIATFTMVGGQSNLQNKDIQNLAQHGGNIGEYYDMDSLLASPYTSVGASGAPQNFRVRYEDGTVRLCGAISQKSGLAFPNAADITLGVMRNGMVPKVNKYLTGVCAKNTSGASGTMTWQCVVASNGNIIARIPSTNAPLSLVFDGMTYDLS